MRTRTISAAAGGSTLGRLRLAGACASVILSSLLILACDGKSNDEESGGADSNSEGQCTPETSFMAEDGCNTCQCPASGLKADAACTEIACGEQGGSATSAGSTSTGGMGTTTGSETVTSSETGVGTTAADTSESGSDTSGHDPDACEPGSTFDSDDGCNTCRCPLSGKKSEADCSDRACEECFVAGSCGDTSTCNFGLDNCGIQGIEGSCIDKPEACDDGGVPTCTCDGQVVLNACEAHAQDNDVMRYGGCELNPGSFRCGDIDCKLDVEYCLIQFNDVADPEQPEYFATCQPLPADCQSRSCECLPISPFGSCHQAGQQLMQFEPGG